MFQGCVPMDIPCQISEPNAMATSDMDPTVQKLVSFLSKQKQVLSVGKYFNIFTYKYIQSKCWVRQVERSIAGTGSRGIVIRGQATTLADASDFVFQLNKMNVTVIKKKSIRYGILNIVCV